MKLIKYSEFILQAYVCKSIIQSIKWKDWVVEFNSQYGVIYGHWCIKIKLFTWQFSVIKYLKNIYTSLSDIGNYSLEYFYPFGLMSSVYVVSFLKSNY